MEEREWKRDETPYIVFACTKCKQYTYVKEAQKTKKCLRCGHMHKVSDIKKNGEIVKGITKAVELVKRNQERFAIETLGVLPEFSTPEDYKITPKKRHKESFIEDDEDQERNLTKFRKMLIEMSKLHPEFPFYVIEINAENYGIPTSELGLLTRKLLRNGTLKRSRNNYMYRLNS